jgi:hypothetical protein
MLLPRKKKTKNKKKIQAFSGGDQYVRYGEKILPHCEWEYFHGPSHTWNHIHGPHAWETAGQFTQFMRYSL